MRQLHAFVLTLICKKDALFAFMTLKSLSVLYSSDTQVADTADACSCFLHYGSCIKAHSAFCRKLSQGLYGCTAHLKVTASRS